MAEPTTRVWSVSALVRAVGDALEARFNPVAVRGEIVAAFDDLFRRVRIDLDAVRVGAEGRRHAGLVEYVENAPDAGLAAVLRKGDRLVIERAGFRLAGRAEINANPRDTKDHPEGVWSLPPTYRMKDVDRARFATIGESDRFTLKFIKP